MKLPGLQPSLDQRKNYNTLLLTPQFVSFLFFALYCYQELILKLEACLSQVKITHALLQLSILPSKSSFFDSEP